MMDIETALLNAQRSAAGVPMAVFNLVAIVHAQETDKASLREQITTLQRMLREAREEIAALQEKSEQITTLQGMLAGAREEIAALKERLGPQDNPG